MFYWDERRRRTKTPGTPNFVLTMIEIINRSKPN